MKFSAFILFVLLSLPLHSQPAATLNQSLSKAKEEHKKVLFYFSGSDWCSPCVRFKKNYIDNPTFKDFSEKNLLLFNADFPRQKKNALPAEQTLENERLAEKYNPKGLFPLIILFNENGNIIKKWEELPSESVEEFISQLK
ncbi:thioredoxin family protein [Flavobacterium wongokense]|uniref:thioredoxin family protein n=1 Tax=Flavobacterium wongokense TaxID=2910674 RepID=UPI001F468EA7|nr:thioredoxin family protein [Flavobacterium sp. WG47]MCF6132939.1 thioredoxin family protein [Flavobacterium sp. WG47]